MLRLYTFPTPSLPNQQGKSFSYPASPKSHNIKLKPHSGIPQTHQVSLSRFPNRFVFLKLLVTNAERLDFEKHTELEGFQNQIDIIAITQVQSHDPRFLRLTFIQSLLNSVL